MAVPADGFIGLSADRNERLEVLRRYAERWQIPNKPVDKIPSSDVDAIFCSGRPVHAIEGRKVVLSPSGVEDATRRAQDYGLTVTPGTAMMRLPVSRELWHA